MAKKIILRSKNKAINKLTAAAIIECEYARPGKNSTKVYYVSKRLYAFRGKTSRHVRYTDNSIRISMLLDQLELEDSYTYAQDEHGKYMLIDNDAIDELKKELNNYRATIL